MRRALLVALAALAYGCGGGDAPDFAPNFAGFWTGTLTTTDPSTGSVLGTNPAELEFVETSRSILKFYNACVGNNGPFLQATSTTEFSSIAAYTCASVPDGQCGSVVLTYNSISGALSGSTLTFTASLTGALCGQNESLNASFTGTH